MRTHHSDGLLREAFHESLMMRPLFLPLLLSAWVVSLAAAVGTAPGVDDPWPTIAPLFHPPPEFAGQWGTLRSPLLFRDATVVKSPSDWSRRRQQILGEWHGLMGPWPPLLTQPSFDILSSTNRAGLIQHRVRVGIAPGQTSEGWLLVPPGPGPFPAVLVVYYEPETSVGLDPKQPHRDFGLQLARRGFVTLNIGTPGGNAWKPDLGGAVCQPLSFHAYVAANCWNALANRPEVDARRIGIVGHSYGGKWALFGGALWDKFAAVAVSDPGIVFDETRPNVNYWEPWYLGADPATPRTKAGVPTDDNPRTGAYRRLIETGRDLHELHALIAPRPFFVSGGAEDPPSRWIPLNHAVAVNAILGFTNRVGLSQRPDHSPTEESNAQLYAFFGHFLGARSAPPGLAAKYPGDVGLEHDPAVLFAENFEEPNLEQLKPRWETVTHPEIMSWADDVPTGSGGHQSLLMTQVDGKGDGGQLYRRLPPGHERVFARFYVKFAPDCAAIHHFGTCIGGNNPATPWPMVSAGKRPAGDKSFWTGIEPFGEAWHWDYYTYWGEMRGSPPRGQTWGNSFIRDDALKVERGRWICIEVMVKMNDVGDTNGEMALWLDGRPVSHLGKGFPKGKWVFDKFLPGEGGDSVRWDETKGDRESFSTAAGGEPFEGFRWRTEKGLNVNFVWAYLYITDAPAGHVSRVWFDDLVVATEYIGPIRPQ